MTSLARFPVRGLLVPAALVAFAVLGCAAGNEPPARQPAVYSAAAFHNTTSYGGASFSADESRLLISSDMTGVWAVCTACPSRAVSRGN